MSMYLSSSSQITMNKLSQIYKLDTDKKNWNLVLC